MYAGVVVPNPRNSFPWWLLIIVQSHVITTSGMEYPLSEALTAGPEHEARLLMGCVPRRSAFLAGAPRASSSVEVGLVVVPRKHAVQRVPDVVARFGPLARLPERRVALQEMDPHAIPMRRTPVPRTRLVGVPERFLAQRAYLRRRADPR